MQDITRALAPEDVPAVVQVLEEAQKRYRMALLDMRTVYSTITEDINYFGFSPEYVPFPTLGWGTNNTAFETIMSRAMSKLMIATERENDALTRNRAFETDGEEFQAELVRLRTNYENQLGEVCGSFEGEDGRIYPAVSSYADLSAQTRRVGDPCGRLGSGAIASAMGEFEKYRLDLLRVRASYENVLAEIEIERSRAEAQCDLTLDIADYRLAVGHRHMAFKGAMTAAKLAIQSVDRAIGIASTVAKLAHCVIGAGTTMLDSCATGITSALVFTGASVAGMGMAAVSEVAIAAAEAGMTQLDLRASYWETTAQCDALLIDSNARMATLALRLKEIELEALRSEYTVQSGLTEIGRQFNLAKRLEQELAEAQQFAINIQAARNDPNVRIYRNDAVLNADLSFKRALQEAYRATKVFEYYTSQSYAQLEQLFLIRMVQYGDYNLANYLAEMQDAFYLFEETYGMPDHRVAILSLRDDILRIPRVDDLGRALTKIERIDRMREALADPSLLDENGYLSIGFSTNFEALSPLTRNHKVLALEAELVGSEIGDTLGRVYLRQQGTSVIDGLYGAKVYYRFPERMAVINPFFNGTRVFERDIYRNERMLDRPYINTAWELVLNQRDEQVNQDINLQSLTDLRVYVYYSDFTQF